MGSDMQNLYVNQELDIVVAMTASVPDFEYDLAGGIIRQVRLAVSGYNPNASADAMLLGTLAILGLASVIVVPIVIGGIFYLKKRAPV